MYKTKMVKYNTDHNTKYHTNYNTIFIFVRKFTMQKHHWLLKNMYIINVLILLLLIIQLLLYIVHIN